MGHDAESADSLLAENAQLRAQLEYVIHDRELEYGRMAAIVEACEALADFIESYGPDSRLALYEPTFYGIFRVYGKNARAAAAAVRPQADALLARMADLSRQIGELNTTIGYQDAMLAQLRTALDQIDRHVVGACEAYGVFPEPCEECGEMREIAASALAAIGKVRSE